jgi:hypothetical protein
MISLEKFKELLGEAGRGLTDKEIEEIRTEEYQIAGAIFDFILEEKNSNPQKMNSRLQLVIVYTLYSLLHQSTGLFFRKVLGPNIFCFKYENQR